MRARPHPKFFKGDNMDNHQASQQIKKQLEALVIEAILSVLKKLTQQQISEVRKNSEMKF
jgi:DNA-binding transcriptional regulator YiaG